MKQIILFFGFADKNREVLTKYGELWNKIKKLIETISYKSSEHVKKSIKIKFDSDGNPPSNKLLKLHNLTIVARSVFQEGNKYYLQFFLDKCLYEL